MLPPMMSTPAAAGWVRTLARLMRFNAAFGPEHFHDIAYVRNVEYAIAVDKSAQQLNPVKVSVRPAHPQAAADAARAAAFGKGLSVDRSVILEDVALGSLAAPCLLGFRIAEQLVVTAEARGELSRSGMVDPCPLAGPFDDGLKIADPE